MYHNSFFADLWEIKGKDENAYGQFPERCCMYDIINICNGNDCCCSFLLATQTEKISSAAVSVTECWYEKEGIYNFSPAFQRSGRL